ncbi:TonB-dependent receptor [Thiomicrorhabdus immobilis]|uniref:TonB-dependent receptor n=1 Tax=Thiomicrorhabdus immobilis TaxID=2791037 RepID=A0ABN6CXG2_9GAMM|nr:TonB-dependent receptor [Thiomicrorhabdus immobilis]BCN93680.1 TonB-dependent receptor [Thiomicrorhabdus immobilis]
MFTPKKITLAILSACLVPNYAFATDLAPVEVLSTQEATQQETVDAKKLLQTGNSETGTTLRQIPGVDASRMGGHGVDLVIRGQQASQLNVLIDGAKIEGGCPNRMDPPTAYAEMSSFDDVTVIKGVNSVTYGSGGTGGTVLFERNAPTFEDGKPYNGEINLGTTSNGLTKDINATVSAGGDKGYIVLQGSKKSADNYKDGNNNTVESSYESQQGHIDLGWTPNENHELRLSYENTLVEDALFAGSTMDSPKSDGTTTRIRYKGKNLSENIQAIEADIYSSNVDHVMNNFSFRPATPVGMKRETVSDVQTKGAKIKLTSMIAHTQLDYGVQFESVEKMATLTNMNTGNTLFFMWPNTIQETKSAFVESTSLFKNQQKLVMGLRYDSVTTEAKDAALATDEGNIATDVYNGVYYYSGNTKTDDANINALLRYERKYDNNINVFAGVSRTHRYPDATELYMNKLGMGDHWIGNPDLKPEQHNQFDIGMSQNQKDSSWSISAYYDKVNDYILRDYAKNQTTSLSVSPDKTVIYLNKDATLFGLEASGTVKATQHITLGGNASLANGTNETDNRNLSNIAPLSGSVFADYSASNWNVGSRFNFATNQDSVNAEFNELATPGWNTVDLYGNYQINKMFKLSAGVDNMFDHAYYTYMNRTDPASGKTYKVYEPGRVVWAKLNAKF